MSINFEQLATVNITIQSAAVATASYNNILIIGPLPATAPATAPAEVGVYTSLAAVTAAGWDTTLTGSDPVGKAAAVAFGQKPKPTRIFIAPIQTTTSGGTTTAEYASATLERALGVDGWYCLCPAGVAAAEIPALATMIEAQEKMMIYTELGFFGAGANSTNVPTVTAECVRTAGIYGRVTTTQTDANIPEANKYMNVAMAVAWLAYESGSETAAFKRLYMVTPSTMSKAEMDALAQANLNYCCTVGNKDITMVGKVLGDEWMDIIRFRDWLKNEIQARVANLFQAVPKIPYVDSGIALVHNAVAASLKRGQDIGGIYPNEFDEDGVETPGYEVNVPLASSVSDTDKASRTLTDITFRARLAGAIHVAELNGTLAYSL